MLGELDEAFLVPKLVQHAPDREEVELQQPGLQLLEEAVVKPLVHEGDGCLLNTHLRLAHEVHRLHLPLGEPLLHLLDEVLVLELRRRQRAVQNEPQSCRHQAGDDQSESILSCDLTREGELGWHLRVDPKTVTARADTHIASATRCNSRLCGGTTWTEQFFTSKEHEPGPKAATAQSGQCRPVQDEAGKCRGPCSVLLLRHGKTQVPRRAAGLWRCSWDHGTRGQEFEDPGESVRRRMLCER